MFFRSGIQGANNESENLTPERFTGGGQPDKSFFALKPSLDWTFLENGASRPKSMSG
jgi:hypothetical protein